MHGAIMDLCPDAGLVEMAHEMGTGDAEGVEIDVNHVKVPSVVTVRWAGNGAHIRSQWGKGLVVGGGEGLAMGEEAVELAQLAKAEGAMDSTGTIVVA